MSDVPRKNRNEIENIWITSKSRMNAEKRYRLYGIVSHLLVTYLAFLMIITTIFGDALAPIVPFFPQINISIAVALFSASLIVYGFRYDETARAHRDCYLRLQRLLSTSHDDPKIIEKYHEILGGYPNHSPRDYEDLVIERTFLKTEGLRNAEGNVQWTYPMLVRRLGRWFFFWGAVVTIIVFPASLLITPWMMS